MEARISRWVFEFCVRGDGRKPLLFLLFFLPFVPCFPPFNSLYGLFRHLEVWNDRSWWKLERKDRIFWVGEWRIWGKDENFGILDSVSRGRSGSVVCFFEQKWGQCWRYFLLAFIFVFALLKLEGVIFCVSGVWYYDFSLWLWTNLYFALFSPLACRWDVISLSVCVTVMVAFEHLR